MSRFCRRLLDQPSSRLGALMLSSSLAVTGMLTMVAACEADETKSQLSSRPSDRIIFLGTGSSTGCPRPLCTMLFGKSFPASNTDFDKMREQFRDKCNVSNKAIIGNPLHNKDYRNNPSLLIAQYDEQAGRMKHVIIDVGKTFREASLRWFPKHGIYSVDAIILTHEHADASFGLDDVRGYQRVLQHATSRERGFPETVPMKLFLSQPCLDKLSHTLPWLFPKAQKVDSSKPVVHRFVSSLDVKVFQSFDSLQVEGLTVIPLPVMHGEDLLCYGFAFRCGTRNIVYLSDISRMLPETMDFIRNKLPPTDILIVDSLYLDRVHPVHYSLEQAADIASQIRPKQTLLVGMNCDTFLPHDEMNKELQQKYENFQLAHDGLAVEC